MPISPLESMIKHGGRPTLEQNIADIGKALIRGTSVVPESLSGIVKMGEDITGLQGTWDDRLAQVAERLRQRFAPSPSLREGGFKYRPVMSLLSGIGESTPYTLGTAGAGALVGAATRSLLAGLLTQMGLVGGLASGQTYKEAREAGTKPSKAGLLAGLRGIGEAGLEFAPAETFLARLFGKGKGGLGRAILEQSLAEGVTEPTQQVWENLLAKAYDPNRPLMQGVPESAIIGGAMGGLMGGGAHLFSGATPSLVEATPQPETDLMRDKDLIIEETPIEEVRALPYYPLMLPKGKTPASNKVIPLPPPPETKLVGKKPIVLPAPSKSKVAGKKITREIIQQNPDVIFVFGDNDLRRGKGGQAYSARGEKNVLGIRTKKKPATTEDSYYADKEFEQNKKKIIEDVLRVKRAIDEGKKVYFLPKIGEGRAELQRRAPKTYAFLKKALNTLKKYAAQKGALVTSLEEKATTPIKKETITTKKLLPAKSKIFTLPTTKTVIREVESPIYRKKTPREVYRLKLKPSGEEILFEIVRPSQQLPTEETIAPQKRVRESYREKKLSPEANDYRWLKTRELAYILQGEKISRPNLIRILENMGWEGNAAESVADKILAGEVKPLAPEKFQQIYDFKQKKRLEAPTAVRFNIYTKDGDLIYTGYGTPRKIQQAMREIATEASRGVKFQDILNKVKEEFPSPEETTTLTPQEAIKKMLLGEITTPEAVLALTRHGYTREQAEATVNAAWEKYASTKPFIQAKDLQAYIKKMQDEGIDKNEAVKLWITRRAMEEGMSEAEYARKVINEALQKPKVTSQLAYIRKNLFPDLSRDDWKAIRQQAVLNNLIDSQPHLFSREDTLEDIRKKIEENVKGIPKQEREKLAKQLYNLKESIIPYDDEVALTSDLVEDLFYKSALYEAFPKYSEGMRRLFKFLEDESGEIKFAPDNFDSLFDKLKLFSTAVPVLEAAGPETAALVQDARDMYEGMAMGHSQIIRYHREYSDLMKSLPKYAQDKLAQWFKRNYDRTNTDRATLRKEFHTFLSRNPAIPKEKALKLFDLIRDMNDLLNLFYSEIESLYDNDLLFKINIIDPDAIRLPNGEVISRGTARVKIGTKVLAQSTPVVQAEIQYFTQQGIRKQYITLKKEGDWFKELEKIARKRLQTELRPWVNYIPHYREVKVGWYWAIIRDNTIKKGEKTIFAKAYPNKETALKEAIKEAKRRGLDPESKEVEIEIKQHQENPDSIPIDVLPIEVEGWLARLGIDPESDEARRIVNDLKKRSGFYSHFIRSRNIDGWMDTLDGFLRGFIQSFNSAMFTYQRLYAKKHMFEKLRKIEKNENYSKTIKDLAKKFVESYTEFEKLGKFSRALLKTRAFLYIYALQNKATYVLQNITEWIHSIPAVIDALQERGISEAKAIPIALKAFARVFKPASPDIKALEAKARRNGLTDYKTWLKYELHPDAMDTLLEFLADLDVLGKESEKFSSQVTFRVGLEVAKEIGLKGEAAYKFARDFLLGKGKIFMTKGNKIGAYLMFNPAVSRVLYPVFTTVVADILGRVFVKPKISKTLLFLLMYGLLAGVEGLPFVNKKKFSEINSPLEVVWRKGVLGLAGIDTGFLSLNPFFRAKFYLSDRPYQTMQKALDLLKSAFQVASIGAFIDSVIRASRIADKYDLSPGMFLLISTPLGGLQHIIKGLLRATYGERVYNKYRKQYRDLGWRPSTLKDYIYEALDIPTSGRFDAWQRYKKGAEYRHRLWVIKHGGV